MALQLYFQYNDKDYCVEVKPDAIVQDLWIEINNIIEHNDDFNLSFGEVELCGEKFFDSLADLGICNESKISIVDIINEDVIKIIENYDEDTLDAYCEAFEYKRSEVEYNEFQNSYFGRFETKEEFVNYVIEELNGINNPDWVNINYESTWSNVMVDFNEADGYYFWNY